MEAKIYNITGKEVGTVALPESIFGLKWNADLVHQVVTSTESSRRDPIAHTKTRGEVRGGGKKPWKQKGTGRARHGSTRSPIWVGGGVAHGPRNDKNYDRKVNRKMNTKALYTILAKKHKDGEVIFVDTINFESPKTKFAKTFIENVGKNEGLEKFASKKRNKAFIALTAAEASMKRSFENFGNIQTGDVRNLNPVDIMGYKYLVITNPDATLKELVAKLDK